MGSFHAIMTYLSSLGRIWGDAGLRDLPVDSGVYAAGTAELFLQGKEYNRAVKAYIYVYETLSQVRLTEFLKYLERKEQKLPDELWEHLSTTKELFYSGSMLQSAVTELQNLVEKHVQPLMAEFRAEFSKKSPTFQIWDSLIDAIHNLLLNLRAEREGDWPLHLHSFLSFLPYYAITDKPNYTRYSPVYLMDMLALPDNVERAFNRGEFSVRETCGGFIGIASDMGTEHKIKELKGHGGIKNISKKKPSMIRFSLTRHVTGNWATQLKRKAHPKVTEKEVHLHKDERNYSILQDESNVCKLVDHINHHMSNPFDIDADMPEILINISTGMHATPLVKESLLDCVKDGTTKYEQFVKRVLSVGGEGNFFDPIKKSKLMTFKDLSKPVKVKTTQGIKATTINPVNIFRRSIALIRYRKDLDFLTVMSKPTGGAPLSMFY